MDKHTEAPARTLGHELAREVRALSELSDNEVDLIAGGRSAFFTTPYDGSCTD